ncbi:alpha/beta hydrolase [Streptomyces albiaxialis]|uniref:Alpha/beta hydrolase n=1 Tax=Streptomyces albiaxialis TaxID=329523 RepID=A0ABN2X5X6_9ACTN
MRDAQVTPDGARIRWVEIPAAGEGDGAGAGAGAGGGAGGGGGVGIASARPRVWLHGLGASSGPYFAASAAHPLLAGPRSLLVDLLGFGISDRPADFGYSLEEHADALARALEAADLGAGGADVVAHSMGGSVAIVLAARHPHLVARMVLIDANLDPIDPQRNGPGSSGISAQTEEEFLAGGWRAVRDKAGPHWWSTMRLAGREALHRSAVHLARATVPTMRELLLKLEIPRTFLRPEGDGPLPDEEGLVAGGVTVVPVPDCGHNVMLDNPEAFVRATAAALRP